MSNPRIIKKLSKRIVEILPKTYKHAWVDGEHDYWQPHWKNDQSDGKLTKKQIRENRVSRSRVNHVFSVGGELDYWGEGQDYYSVYRDFAANHDWFGVFGFRDIYLDSDNSVLGGYPNRDSKRMTGNRLIQIAKAIAGNGEKSFEMPVKI